jgi:hypothetical protein
MTQPVLTRRSFLQALGLTAAAIAAPAIAAPIVEAPIAPLNPTPPSPQWITLRPHSVGTQVIEQEITLTPMASMRTFMPVAMEIFVEAAAEEPALTQLHEALKDPATPVTLHMQLADHPLIVTGLLLLHMLSRQVRDIQLFAVSVI